MPLEPAVNDGDAGPFFDTNLESFASGPTDERAIQNTLCGGVGLGAGNDVLLLKGYAGDILKGGTGDAVLELRLEVLSGGGSFPSGGTFKVLIDAAEVNDFETLRLDRAGDRDDIPDQDASSDPPGVTADGGHIGLYIAGDTTDDRVDTAALEAAGWIRTECKGHTRWSYVDGEETLSIQIQTVV